MDGRRSALIIASDDYENAGLRRLRGPAADARALADVLGDKEIGGFAVKIVHNEPAYVVEGEIEDLFAESQTDDVVLLHFSGHGIKSDSGELFFATTNTRPDRLASTAVPADFVQRCMRTARARSIVLFLDCCYGGAFGEGVAVRAAGSANVLESFPSGRLGGGRGRAVITASSAMEYAFEGSSLADEHQQQPSVFTSALVEGLSTGEADRDEDGLVSLNELYDYVFDRVRERNPKQTPGRDVELQGELYLARSQRRRVRPLAIPGDVAAALKDDNPFTRLGGVAELRNRLASTDLGAALGAHEALVEVARADITYVAAAASEALAATRLKVVPTQLDLGELAQGTPAEPSTVRLVGTPLARSLRVDQADPWLVATVGEENVTLTADTSQAGLLTGAVTLVGPAGQVSLPVRAVVVPVPQPVEAAEPPASQAEVRAPVEVAEPPAPQAEVRAPAEVTEPPMPQAKVSPRAEDTPTPEVVPQAEPAARSGPAPSAPLVDATAGAAEAAQAARAAQAADETPTPVPEETPAPAQEARVEATRPAAPPRPDGIPARAGLSPGTVAGWAVLAAAALLLLGTLSPLMYDESTYDKDPTTALWIWLVTPILVVAGWAALRRPRAEGQGAALGVSPLALIVLLDLLAFLDARGTDVDIGFWLLLLGAVVLGVGGAAAALSARREADARFTPPNPRDWAVWAVLVLAVLAAVPVVGLAMEGFTNVNQGVGLGYLLVALLALWVPVLAVLARPVPLGRWALGAWSLGATAPAIGLAVFLVNEVDGNSRSVPFVVVCLLATAALSPLVHRAGQGRPSPGA